MSPEKKGLNIIFEPTEKKVQLEEDSREKISGEIEGFLEKEGLWEKITPDMSYIIANYPKGDFPRGPVFIIKPKHNSEEQGWWLRISSGQTNYMEFALDRKDKSVEIIELTFAEKAYSPRHVEEWIESVLNGIHTAQDRDSFEWKIK